ncbi:putative capsid protein [Gammarus sp. amphipod associated circular virus]|uniref:Putative capsid protein n=1 Tax=Gammarus sp. amphipod associated circular virus TaxID=1692250 RepID=A0A0K1RL71_9CIRC|nr:putative capsid protein [Gammarus sp. amphipod associated circular virus]AKV62288.1 putative capsid protein [Gammarus sp. amphipod associated circular virus]
MPYRKSYRRRTSRKRFVRRPRKARAYRQKRGLDKTRIGATPGSRAPCKRITKINQTTAQGQNDRELYVYPELTAIPKGDAINNRQRDVCTIVGFRINWEMTVDTRNAMYWNMAIVCPKPKARDLAFQTGDNVSTEQFFRGDNQQRGEDFSLSLTSQEMHYKTINSDLYNVLWRKKMLINGSLPLSNEEQIAQNASSGKNYRIGQKYIKLNRQMMFEDNQSNYPIYLLTWGARFEADSGAPISAGSPLAVRMRVLTFFREPRN